MASFDALLSLVPIFLESESKEELVRKMALTNMANQTKFNYMSPLKDGKMWVVWFYANIENYTSIEGLSDSEKSVIGGFK